MDEMENPVRTGNGLVTEHAAAILVLGSLAALWLIRRGFTSVNVAGVRVGIQ